jgi:hypothetical protein
MGHVHILPILQWFSFSIQHFAEFLSVVFPLYFELPVLALSEAVHKLEK